MKCGLCNHAGGDVRFVGCDCTVHAVSFVAFFAGCGAALDGWMDGWMDIVPSVANNRRPTKFPCLFGTWQHVVVKWRIDMFYYYVFFCINGVLEFFR